MLPTMKKAAVALLLLVVVLGIVFVVAARNLNHYLESNRPWIEEQVEAALGRPVEIGGLSASIGWGVSAKVSER